MTKHEELKKLENEMKLDESLPLRRSNLVFGEGDPESKIVFVGEAPGFFEDKMKRPFVGRSGKLLDKLIGSVGWSREKVYITNIVKRRPPANRDPLPREIERYKPYLARQIEIINPSVIVPLGRFSMNYFLPLAKVSRDNGKVFRLKNRLIVPLFHPAAALRSTGTLNELTVAFKKLSKIVLKSAEFLKNTKEEKEEEINKKEQEKFL